MKCVKQEAVIRDMQKKHMSPIQIHQDLCETLGENVVLYGIVKSWYREFMCSSESCEG